MLNGNGDISYAVIRKTRNKKISIIDDFVSLSSHKWINLIKLLRNETISKLHFYRYNENDTDVDIFVNDDLCVSISVSEFLRISEIMANDIRTATGSSFEMPEEISDFLARAQVQQIKAKAIDKSDVFLSTLDPHTGIARKHIGFSIKSEFGKPPTLFNTAKASAFIYKLSNMNDTLMNEINSIADGKNHADVIGRCEALLSNGCEPRFVGFPVAARAKEKAFEENLELINCRLVTVLERCLWNYFFLQRREREIKDIIDVIIGENPCILTHPDEKYPYMIKSFLYSSYCGLTASTRWNGKSDVNGGFIEVGKDGSILAHYAMESESFKNYLYNHCYLETPQTDPSHGDYGKVYFENGEYYFRLNFQIRYK